MDVYFAPLSCSLATRIALYESGQPAAFHEVELGAKRLRGGGDYLAVNPKGQVPALRTDDGRLLTEGPAVLQFVADRAPEAALAPPFGTPARYELQLWLNYIATEVHKAVFSFLFNPATPPETKAFVREALLPSRYDHLSGHLRGREFLLDRFSVADAYLVTSLNWAAPAGVELGRWPVLAAYHRRLLERPAVARAFREELALRERA
jgi:glutathione S-transferase